MNQLDGARRILLADDDGKVQLRRPLGDHQNVDIGGPENTEGSGSNTGNALDPLSHQRDDRNVRYSCNAIDAAAFNLGFEFAPECFDRLVPILLPTTSEMCCSEDPCENISTLMRFSGSCA